MTLALEIQARGHDRWTVALSLAANRASKIELLLGDDSARCTRIAARYNDALVADVAAFLAKHPHTKAQALRLHCAATTDPGRVARLRTLPKYRPNDVRLP